MVSTLTYDNGDDGRGVRCGIRRIINTFLTDDSAGTATVNTEKIVGELIKVVTDPGATAPTDNWDVVVTDENGLSPFAGCQNVALLLARDTANTEETYMHLLDSGTVPLSRYPVVCGPLTIAVANAGNAKNGTITIYVKPL
jgi:hypothetical protein